MSDVLLLGNYRVPGFDLKVNGDMEIRTEDLSGESSGTARADKGVKPKKFSVSLGLQFDQKAKLSELIRVAEAKDKNGEGLIYNITNRDANVAGVRQVRFSDRFSWPKMEGVEAWSVSFTLREYLSVSEKNEARTKPVKSVAQTNAGNTVPVSQQASAATPAPEVPTASKSSMSNVEQVLSFVDDLLASGD